MNATAVRDPGDGRTRGPGLASLALTFDDGPDPRGTPAVLDALERGQAAATFFVISDRAQRHPDLLRSVQDAGHRVELHCARHVRHTEMSEAEIRSDTERALDQLDALGVRPALWRVPWGVPGEATAAVAAEYRLTLMGWNVDTHDWRGDSADEMLARTRPDLKPGQVVLAHDGVGPGAQRADCLHTAAYVDLVAEHAASTGLVLASL